MPVSKSRQEKLANMRLQALSGELNGQASATGQPTGKHAKADEGSGSGGSKGSMSARGPKAGGLRDQLPQSARGPGDVPREHGAQLDGNPPGWAMFDKLAATLQEQDAFKARLEKRQLQERFRHDLEKQVSDAKLRRDREREIDSKYHEDMVASYQTWRDGEAAKESQARQKAMEGAQGLRETAMQKEQRRNMETQKEKAESLEYAKRIKREAEEEEHRQAVQLAIKRGEYKAVLQANQAAKLEIREASKATRDEDAVKQAYFQLQRDARAKMVEEAKQAKVEKRMNISESMGTVLAESEQKLQNDQMQKAAAERAAMDRKAVDAENEKHARLREERSDTQKHQIGQIQERRAAKQAELDHKKTLAHQLETDTRAFHREMEDHSDATRLRNLHFRHELEKQIQVKSAAMVVKKDSMNETELRINRRLMENAQQILGSSGGFGSGALTAR